MHQDIEKLLNAAKEKGFLTEKQREIILNKARQLGEDMAEVEFFLEDIKIIDKRDNSLDESATRTISAENEKVQEQSMPEANNNVKPVGVGNKFVSVERDNFDDKTITRSTTLDYKLSGRKLTLTEGATFKFRHVKSSKYELLLIDVHFTSMESDIRANSIKDAIATFPGEWAFLREGELAIRINEGETIHLPAHESDSDVTRESFTNASSVQEVCYYEINENILKKICDATSIKIRLTGGKGQWELEGDGFRTLAQAFYNGCFDNTKYADQVQHATDIDAQKKKIKKTGCIIEIIAGILFVWACYEFQYQKNMEWLSYSLLIIVIITAIVSYYLRKSLK